MCRLSASDRFIVVGQQGLVLCFFPFSLFPLLKDSINLSGDVCDPNTKSENQPKYPKSDDLKLKLILRNIAVHVHT